MPELLSSDARWTALRQRLNDRLAMARRVLDEAGHGNVAALVPIEEVLIWMDEADAALTEGGATDGG